MYDFERAIIHIDGDAFFASCEQATKPSLRNKPIVIGHERGVATAFSYEAKELGVQRGMTGKVIRKEFPQVRMISSDYRKYSLYSKRMKNIVARYTDKIEKTSIDECYAEITNINCTSYEQLISEIQTDLIQSLGVGFSIGLGPTKILSKLASGLNKPKGLTVVNSHFLKTIVYALPVGRVSGIGFSAEKKLHTLGIFNIGQFVARKKEWVEDAFSKPYQEIYSELQGKSIRALETKKSKPKSVSKIHAFAEPTNNEQYLLSELSRNTELVCTKLQANNINATKVSCGLKTFDGLIVSQDILLQEPTRDSSVVYKAVKKQFRTIYNPSLKYRATYVCVHHLVAPSQQKLLFQQDTVSRDREDINEALRDVQKKFGTRTIYLGSSRKKDYKVNKSDARSSGTPLMTSANQKRILELIYLGITT